MKYFKFFSTCFLVKGLSRSIILDTQRQESKIISNDLYDIIFLLKKGTSINGIKKEYTSENRIIIDEYVNFLIENEYGFICNKIEFNSFPEMSLSFQNPFIINDIIIEFSIFIFENFKRYLLECYQLSIKNISIIIYENENNETINLIIKESDKYNFKSIEIILKYHKNINDVFFKSINYNNSLTKLIFFSAPKDEILSWDDKILFDRIFIKKNINSFSHCGIVDIKYFNTNMPKVLESLNHNSCLHKKISIDINGNIKNCPSMPQSFGNIKDTTLEQALEHPDFKKYWNITKDQIEVCKDCEFRHICTDCRAYTEDPENMLSKPLKCGYSPYTNVWEEWSTNPLKQKAIEYYGMQELIKKDA
jgi:SPASM domain peptide maturase of grasp-with-spasm system